MVQLSSVQLTPPSSCPRLQQCQPLIRQSAGKQHVLQGSPGPDGCFGKFLAWQIFFFQNSDSWYYLKVLMSLAFITKLLNTGTHDHLTETHNQSFLYINENILEKNV